MPANRVSIEALWSHGFVLAILINFLVGLIFFAFVTTIALYAIERFQVSEGIAGFAAGAFVLGALASRVLVGKFLDHIGRRRMFLIGLAIFVVTTVLYLAADSLALLILIRLAHGAAFGIAHTAITASVMALIPVRRRGEGTGYYGVANSLSTALGPLLGVYFVGYVSYNALFFFASACAIGALIVALFLRPPEVVVSVEAKQAKWRYRLPDIIDPAAIGISATMFLAGVAFSGVMVFLSSYAESLGVGEAAALFFIVYASVGLIGRLFIGRMQDRHGDNAVIYPTFASFAIGLALLAFASNGLFLLVAAVFLALGFGALMPCAQAIAVTVVPNDRIGVAVSTFFIALDAGTGIGPMATGTIAALVGFQGMYATLAGLVVATAVLYHFAHGFRRYRPA
ncbi:MFS transporter [Homoserinimonas sp. A447]